MQNHSTTTYSTCSLFSKVLQSNSPTVQNSNSSTVLHILLVLQASTVLQSNSPTVLHILPVLIFFQSSSLTALLLQNILKQNNSSVCNKCWARFDFYCRFVSFSILKKNFVLFPFVFENDYLKRRQLFRFQTKTTSLKLVVSFSVLQKRNDKTSFFPSF